MYVMSNTHKKIKRKSNNAITVYISCKKYWKLLEIVLLN